MAHGDAREGKWRGNWRMERVASTLHTTSERVFYPTLLLLLMRAPRLPVVDWTDAPADLNGLVRFAERRNLVSGACAITFQLTSTLWIVCACSVHIIMYKVRITFLEVRLIIYFSKSCLYRSLHALHSVSTESPPLQVSLELWNRRDWGHMRFRKEIPTKTSRLTLWPWSWTFTV